jgi:hypothetical protein
MNSDFDISSDMSIGTESISVNNNNYETQLGGFLFSNKSDANSTKILAAANSRDFDTVSFMVKNKLVKDYGGVDDDKRTLLHYLAKDYEHYKNDTSLVEAVLSGGQVTNFINKQDKNGDTPLHVAVKYGNVDMASMLDGAGCDLTIKNKDGLKIEAESDNSEEFTNKMNNKSSNNMATKEDMDNVTNIINKFLVNSNNADNFTYSDNNSLAMSTNFMNEYSSKNTNTNSIQVDTENFLDEIFGKLDQTGGAKKRRVTKGNRKLNKKGKHKISRSTELSRLVNRQGSEIHKKVLDNIMKLLKLNKDKPDDVEKARNIKAVMWDQVKKMPSLKSNLDKSVELEKMTNLDNLKKIDPKKGVTLREESRKAREKRMDEKQKSAPGKSQDTMSDTSSSKEPEVTRGGAAFSETSFSDF